MLHKTFFGQYEERGFCVKRFFWGVRNGELGIRNEELGMRSDEFKPLLVKR